MTHGELMWLAGLLEGEGCFGVYDSTQRKRGKTYPRRAWAIQMATVDRDVAERAGALMGVEPYRLPPRNPRHQVQWKVQIAKRADVIAWITRLRPHMGQRRRAAIDRMLAVHASQ